MKRKLSPSTCGKVSWTPCLCEEATPLSYTREGLHAGPAGPACCSGQDDRGPWPARLARATLRPRASGGGREPSLSILPWPPYKLAPSTQEITGISGLEDTCQAISGRALHHDDNGHCSQETIQGAGPSLLEAVAPLCPLMRSWPVWPSRAHSGAGSPSLTLP